MLEGIDKIHVVGIGGIGVSALAKLLKRAGKDVSGSDGVASGTTDELIVLGIRVTIGHAAENLPEDAQLLLYSDAIPKDNPERKKAAKRHLRQASYFELLGELSAERDTIAVSGTNGKSTTTAMLGLMAIDAGISPTVIVGTKVRGFPDQNLRVGISRTLIVEACEHHANMLKLAPRTIVLTNIEADHLDFYRDIDHIRDTFQKYIDKLPNDGMLIWNADDIVTQQLKPKIKPITFGLFDNPDCRAKDWRVDAGRQIFRVIWRGTDLGEFSLPLPGHFNIYNALAALTTVLAMGVKPDKARASLAAFPGVWRRFEKVGERDGIIVYSDYGHHPTAVAGTLAATRQFYPNRRIVLCFQPHQRNRTRNLFEEFVVSMDDADLIVLPEIFDVPGREESADSGTSSHQLVVSLQQRDAARGRQREVHFGGNLPETHVLLQKILRPDDVLLMMGAGDIYLLAEKICLKN